MNIPGRTMAVLAMLLAMESASADPAQELAAWQQQQAQALLQNGGTALQQMSRQPPLEMALPPDQLQGDAYVQFGNDDFRKPDADCESAQLILLPGTGPSLGGEEQKRMISPSQSAVFSVLICKTL